MSRMLAQDGSSILNQTGGLMLAAVSDTAPTELSVSPSSTSTTVGEPVTLVFAIGSVSDHDEVISRTDSAGGTLSPAHPKIVAGQTSVEATITWHSSGLKTLTFSDTLGLTMPDPLAITVASGDAEAPRSVARTTPDERHFAVSRKQTGKMIFDQEADPSYNTNWSAGFGGFLNVGEKIDPATLTAITTAEAEAIGITVDDGPRRLNLDPNGTDVEWMNRGDPDFAEAADFAGDGTLVGTVISFATDANPSRFYQETFYTRTKQK